MSEPAATQATKQRLIGLWIIRYRVREPPGGDHSCTRQRALPACHLGRIPLLQHYQCHRRHCAAPAPPRRRHGLPRAATGGRARDSAFGRRTVASPAPSRRLCCRTLPPAAAGALDHPTAAPLAYLARVVLEAGAWRALDGGLPDFSGCGSSSYCVLFVGVLSSPIPLPALLSPPDAAERRCAQAP